ncbi:hypothetical protein [Tenacibaculum piscium]|nr:hypothetical protein [Tenacibaculum piscium]
MLKRYLIKPLFKLLLIGLIITGIGISITPIRTLLYETQIIKYIQNKEYNSIGKFNSLIASYSFWEKDKLILNSIVKQQFTPILEKFDYENLINFEENNKLQLLEEQILNQKEYITKSIYDAMVATDFYDLKTTIKTFPKREKLYSFLIKTRLVPNIDDYSYNQIYNANQYLMKYSSLDEIDFKLSELESNLYQEISELTFEEFPDYYKAKNNASIYIENHILEYIIPVIKDYSYFDLKIVKDKFKFSKHHQIIVEFCSEKRSEIMSEIAIYFNKFQEEEEQKLFITFVTNLRGNIDDYFNPAFKKFTEEYFDIGSGLYRTGASVIDWISGKKLIAKDFQNDWNKAIDSKKIDAIILNDITILNEGISKIRMLMLADVEYFTKNKLHKTLRSDKIKNTLVSFEGGGEVSESLAAKEALTETGFIAVEGVAAFFTVGTSLLITRGLAMGTEMIISVKNEDKAEQQYKEIYHKSMDKILQQYSNDFLKCQELYYSSLYKKINEIL